MENDKRKAQQIEALKKATEKEAKKEKARLRIDLDEALKEREAETIEVSFKGKIYELPAEPPAWVPIFVNQHTNDEGIIPNKYNLEMLARIFGEEFSEMMLESENNISFKFINEQILIPLLREWGFMDVEDASEGKD